MECDSGSNGSAEQAPTTNDGVRTNGRDSNACAECGGLLRRFDGETVCDDCGLVAGVDRLDRGPDWRGGDGDDADRRTGAPVDYARHDRGLSTRIGYGPTADFSGPRARQLVRMRRLHNRARFESKAERNRAYGFVEIRRIVSAMSMPASIRDQAC